MATDIVRLNMASPAAPAVSINHSSSMQTTHDTSLRSSSMEMHDDSCQVATPTSKRQKLPPLEVPDVGGPTLRNQPHRLSDSGHISDTCMVHTATPQAQRFKDTHDKPPLSPSDPCYGMDLRKAALLRSLMLATEGSATGPERKTVTNARVSRRSKRLQESRPPYPSDSASMEMDCVSNRSSMSPETASSHHL